MISMRRLTDTQARRNKPMRPATRHTITTTRLRQNRMVNTE
ncbi:hypothetical protein PFLUOLIPICF7_23140 [Pseudomonas simiae]|uniref:Uncharacterized protein n=1 Tax=Pseudomonas simiae TaxID=321846 RepID=U1SQM9_9PSED|nr:hypothetical protein PFLUOLIPICF7_23140 [Pseudomonas simiae]ERH48561.1 hypothetical protein O204_12620 [Pseudomonas simiae]